MSEREMTALIALLEKQLGLSWRDIVAWLREKNSIDLIEARLAARGLAGSLLQDIETAAARYADDLTAAYVQAGQRAAAVLDDVLVDALVRFDQTNARAVAHAQANTYELVQGLGEEQRAVVRRVVSEGSAAGTNPREMARSLRDSIGLTDKQAQHVENYRRSLEQGDWGDALRRELRDKRSDRTIRRMMATDDGALTPKQVDSMVDRYRKNYVNYRAETIARTEALRAAHQGADELFLQAIERGDLEVDQLEETWHAGPATKFAREMHQEMDEVSVPYGQDFVFSDGVRMRYPGDPRGGAKHNAKCRCAKSTTIKAADAAKRRRRQRQPGAVASAAAA